MGYVSVGGTFKWRSPFLLLPTTLKKGLIMQFNVFTTVMLCSIV
jgi:hypothetical protein